MKKRKVSILITEELHDAAYLRAQCLLGRGVLDHGIVAKYIRQLIRADVAKGREEGLLLENGTDGELLDAITRTPGKHPSNHHVMTQSNIIEYDFGAVQTE